MEAKQVERERIHEEKENKRGKICMVDVQETEKMAAVRQSSQVHTAYHRVEAYVIHIIPRLNL